eukprot:Sro200_g084910.1 n/a (475) ;mRNA; r:82870-84294
MGIYGEEKARNLIKPKCPQALDIVMRHHHYCDPAGAYLDDLQPHRCRRQNGGVYGLFDADGNIEKVGSTRIFVERRDNHYLKNGGISDPDQFFVLVDMDDMCESANKEFEELYRDILCTLATAPELHQFRRFWFGELLSKRGGDRMGCKNQICRQLLEYAFQLHWDLPARPVLFLMFEGSICDELFRMAREGGERIVDECCKVLLDYSAESTDKSERHCHATSSWKPAHDQLSSMIVTTQCTLADEEYKNNWSNTIPEPAIPNAKTRKEIFSTAYSAKTKAKGRDRLRNHIKAFKCSRFGTQQVDSNDLIFGGDPASGYDDIHDFLGNEYSLEKALSLHSEEIVVYTNKGTTHVLLIHRPLCVASDSQSMIPMENRLRRSITAAILTNAQRQLQGKEPLGPDDFFENPIYAIVAFMIHRIGYHGDLRVSAAFFRDVVTDSSVNALTENQLPKLSSQSAAISKRLRDRQNRQRRQ